MGMKFPEINKLDVFILFLNYRLLKEDT